MASDNKEICSSTSSESLSAEIQDAKSILSCDMLSKGVIQTSNHVDRETVVSVLSTVPAHWLDADMSQETVDKTVASIWLKTPHIRYAKTSDVPWINCLAVLAAGGEVDPDFCAAFCKRREPRIILLLYVLTKPLLATKQELETLNIEKLTRSECEALSFVESNILRTSIPAAIINAFAQILQHAPQNTEQWATWAFSKEGWKKRTKQHLNQNLVASLHDLSKLSKSSSPYAERAREWLERRKK